MRGKREGTDDERWIWPAITGIIRDSGAWCVVLENVRGLLSSGGMDAVLADLSGLGFDAEWTVLSAAEVGASHKRERVFIVGVAHGQSGRFRELRESSGGDRQPDRGIEELADAARHGGSRSHRESRSGRGVCEAGRELADASRAGPQGREQLAAHAKDGRTDGRAGTMPINYRIS